MILVRLWGGLGNQMFQYAAGFALAKKLNTNLKLDPSLLYENLDDPLTVKREFDLKVFTISAPLASKREINSYNPKDENLLSKIRTKLLDIGLPNRNFIEQHYHFDPKLLLQNDNTCLIGNWQSYKYFDNSIEEIKSEFNFNLKIQKESEELRNDIENSNSVCINIRRSDYVYHPIYSKTLGFRGLEYLIPAIEFIKNKVDNPKFFIFSDDLDWCINELQPLSGGLVVDHSHKGKKFSNYLQLMSLCKHQIIPNSTFGWWAAWLNPNPDKIVIAPKIWYQDNAYNTKDLCPKNWVRL